MSCDITSLQEAAGFLRREYLLARLPHELPREWVRTYVEDAELRDGYAGWLQFESPEQLEYDICLYNNPGGTFVDDNIPGTK
jgi:hypothetical protein